MQPTYSPSPVITKFHHAEFNNPIAILQAKRGRLISVCIPTLNEEDTIGDVVSTLRKSLIEKAPIIDELAIMDSGSTDRTREVAAAAGAQVFLASDILPYLPPARGKGENIWKAVAALKGEIICFVDGDVCNMHSRFVLGTLGPLLLYDHLLYVKGYYDRPHAIAESGRQPAGGGRVTEALVRPLLSLFYPELSGLIQPLSGEYAARKKLLESLSMPTGYGVETAHLLDIADHYGTHVLAQTDLDERHHRHQDTTSLGRMSFAILHAFFRRAESSGRLKIHSSLPTLYTYFLREEGVSRPFSWHCPDIERPPLQQIAKSHPPD